MIGEMSERHRRCYREGEGEMGRYVSDRGVRKLE